MASEVKAYNIRRSLTKSNVDVAQSVGGIDFPGINISTSIGTAKEVGKSNIVRITVTTAGRVAFGPSAVAAPAGTVDEISIYLSIGTHYVYATNTHIRGDATIAAASVEILTA